jgi:hypothetical protein
MTVRYLAYYSTDRGKGHWFLGLAVAGKRHYLKSWERRAKWSYIDALVGRFNRRYERVLIG